MSQSWFQSLSLYEGSTVTVCGAYCSIMQYAIRAKLQYKAIQELLVLFHIMCSQSSKLPKTLSKRFFKTYSVPYTSSKVCSQCSTPCHGTSRNVNFPNCHSSSLIGNLIHIPIEKSLQTITSSKFSCIIAFLHL